MAHENPEQQEKTSENKVVVVAATEEEEGAEQAAQEENADSLNEQLSGLFAERLSSLASQLNLNLEFQAVLQEKLHVLNVQIEDFFRGHEDARDKGVSETRHVLQAKKLQLKNASARLQQLQTSINHIRLKITRIKAFVAKQEMLLEKKMELPPTIHTADYKAELDNLAKAVEESDSKEAESSSSQEGRLASTTEVAVPSLQDILQLVQN